MTDSASTLAAALKGDGSRVSHRWANVTAVGVTTVTVTLDGTPLTAERFASYSDPQAGDRVLIMTVDGAPWCVGTVGDERAPRGLVKDAYNTGNSSAWNSTTQVVVQTLSSVPMVSGRRYEIRSWCHIGNASGTNVGGDYAIMRHRIGGTQKGTHPFPTTVALEDLTGDSFYFVTLIDDASTGNHTVDCTGANLSGSGSHQILASSPSDRCWIAVHDVGMA